MTETAGRELAAATDTTSFRAAEDRLGLAHRFADVEQLLLTAIATSFTGTAPVKLQVDRDTATLILQGIPTAVTAPVTDLFALETQQSKGAWWLPESARLTVGVVNLPAHFQSPGRWAMNAAALEAAKVPFAGQPAALLAWAGLVPMFTAVLAPLQLRGPDAGTLDTEQHTAAWTDIDNLYVDLGLGTDDVLAALEVLKPGHGWSRMPSYAQVAAKQQLICALGRHIDSDVIGRWRARCLQPLVDRYYAKARRGTPTARAVLIKSLQPALATFFAGDWLAFLNYLGEQPADGEEIVTTLPEPRLYVHASAKVQQVAAQQNLPVDEVARMLASYLGTDELRSPVERRVAVLKEFRSAFDAAHATHRSGGEPLAGLVDDGWLPQGTTTPFTTPTYEKLLPPALLTNVDSLWGGTCVPRYPDRIVSTLFPQAQMADALGPALRLWNGVALTAWFICEGPYSRTDLQGLTTYHARDLDALAAAGSPIDPTLFAELREAEQLLGPPQPIATDSYRREDASGFTFEVSMMAGSRREGFEILRDIITKYRGSWSATYLDTYLRGRWETELREVAREHNRALTAQGKPPTAKQFARTAAGTTNRWFGGDLSGLYAAIGEKAPLTPHRVQLMPADRIAFANACFAALGGRYVPNSHAVQDPGYGASWELQRLCREAPRFVQLEELLDRVPEEREFHAERYRWPVGVTYPQFASTVEQVRASMTTTRL